MEPIAGYSRGHNLAGGRPSAAKTGTTQLGDTTAEQGRLDGRLHPVAVDGGVGRHRQRRQAAGNRLGRAGLRLGPAVGHLEGDHGRRAEGHLRTSPSPSRPRSVATRACRRRRRHRLRRRRRRPSSSPPSKWRRASPSRSARRRRSRSRRRPPPGGPPEAARRAPPAARRRHRDRRRSRASPFHRSRWPPICAAPTTAIAPAAPTFWAPRWRTSSADRWAGTR